MLMTGIQVPQTRVTPAGWPPVIRTSEPGSFARNTLAIRIPRILDETTDRGRFEPLALRRLLALRAELTEGVTQPLSDGAADNEFWNEVSRDQMGRSWLDVPWYWAESYFYRRLLAATGYFQPGAGLGADPFHPTKAGELEPQAAPRSVEAVLAALPNGGRDRVLRLFYAALWGNRVDLSYRVAAHLGANGNHEEETANLVNDDAQALWDWLARRGRHRIALVADNAGTELLLDLALADGLLEQGLVHEVILHLKGHPFFVSDAMPADLEEGIGALQSGGPNARALGTRLKAHRQAGRIGVRAHWFYTTCLFYFQLPADLADDFASADLVLFKGDVNYRRLLGDAHWPPTASFEQVTSYFPSSLATLRTLKAEVVVGLSQGHAERLDHEDPNWLVNGTRGLIQARLVPE